MNETIVKFGYPGTLLREYEHWVVLLRPKQVTLGAIVLATKGTVTSIPDISSVAFLELKKITTETEGTLKSLFDFEKINYLMLMMVDKHVHFHVIPRYSSEKLFAGKIFSDFNWPGPPDIKLSNDVSPEEFQKLLETIKEQWKIIYS